MSDRARFLLATFCGLLMAAGVHMSMILALPAFAQQDAFSRLKGTLSAETAQLVAAPGGAPTWLADHDPSTAVAACAYDLTQAPLRVTTKVAPLMQSLSFHGRGSGVFFAVTDRAAAGGALELVVMTRRQLDQALAEEDEDEPSGDVRVVAPRGEGFVIVRVVAPTPSLRDQAVEVAKAVTCEVENDDEE